MFDEGQHPQAQGRSGRWAWITVGAALSCFVLRETTRPSRLNIPAAYLTPDDFDYYLKVAQNIVSGHGSTFNRLVPTNGYQPLWEICVLGVVWVTQYFGSLRGFIEAGVLLATIATYALSLRLMRGAGVSAWPSALVSAFLAGYGMHLYFLSMESTAAVVFLLGLLVAVQECDRWLVPDRQGLVRALGVGLLASAAVLSRLDAGIFVALLGLCFWSQRALRVRLARVHVLGVVLGLFPVGLYLLLNHYWFDTWEPISGMAKQLKLDHGFTSNAWLALSHQGLAGFMVLSPVYLALVSLPFLWSWMRPVHRVMGLTALVFPFLHIAVLSWVSDWPLWEWYGYTFRPALCVAFLVLLYWGRLRAVVRTAPVLAALGLVVLASVAKTRWTTRGNAGISAAIEVRGFAATHPGIYAMGDRSGDVANQIDQPVVQLEGLMMDKAFLGLIRNQTPLREILTRYHVRYYVANSPVPVQGCMEFVEPRMSGPHAPHMRGTFCEAPVASWTNFGMTTIIYDLQPEDSRADPPAPPRR